MRLIKYNVFGDTFENYTPTDILIIILAHSVNLVFPSKLKRSFDRLFKINLYRTIQERAYNLANS
jgi:hypothetical protein